MLLRIEEVSKHHDRKAFDCGVNELNQFLQLQARQKAEKNIANNQTIDLHQAEKRAPGKVPLVE